MGNMHHRLNMVLITYLVMAMSAHEGLTSQERKELHPLENSSDVQLKDNTVIAGLHINDTESPGTAEVHSAWPAGLGALTAVLSIGLLIALVVRYRFFRWCLAGNSQQLLLEGETSSQYSQAGALDGEIPVRGMRSRMIHRGESSEDDDDGFIEDNYIQASVREIEEEEENQQEDAEYSDDELVIAEII